MARTILIFYLMLPRSNTTYGAHENTIIAAFTRNDRHNLTPPNDNNIFCVLEIGRIQEILCTTYKFCA